MIEYSIEKLFHFKCELCKKWWSIGDAPIDLQQKLYCPFCGQLQNIKEEKLKLN